MGENAIQSNGLGESMFMNVRGCINPWRQSTSLGRVLRLIIIVIIVAAMTRWEPAAVLPMILGIALGGWIMAGLPVTVTVR